MESVGNEIISYSRAKAIVTAYENAMIEENYRNNLAREQGYEKGHKEGLEKGREEGREEGREQGLEEGHRQGFSQGLAQNRMETAKKMLQEKLSISIIAKCTGLSEEEITKLAET